MQAEDSLCNWVLQSSRAKKAGQSVQYLISSRREEVRISRLLGYKARTWLGSESLFYPNEYVLSEYLTLTTTKFPVKEDATFDKSREDNGSGDNRVLSLPPHFTRDACI